MQWMLMQPKLLCILWQAQGIGEVKGMLEVSRLASLYGLVLCPCRGTLGIQVHEERVLWAQSM